MSIDRSTSGDNIGSTQSPPDCPECNSTQTIIEIAGDVAPEGEEKQTEGAVAGAIGGALAGSPGGPIGVAIGAGLGSFFGSELVKQQADITTQCDVCGVQHHYQVYRQDDELKWQYKRRV